MGRLGRIVRYVTTTSLALFVAGSISLGLSGDIPRARAALGFQPPNAGLAALPTKGHRPVYLAPNVRAELQAAWEDTNPRQPERAYCLEAITIATNRGDSAYLVIAASQQVPTRDSPVAIWFDCGSKPALHTHPPTTCTFSPATLLWSCVNGGPAGQIFYPSMADQMSVINRATPFGIIQWAQDRFTVFYHPNRT